MNIPVQIIYSKRNSFQVIGQESQDSILKLAATGIGVKPSVAIAALDAGCSR